MREDDARAHECAGALQSQEGKGNQLGWGGSVFLLGLRGGIESARAGNASPAVCFNSPLYLEQQGFRV